MQSGESAESDRTPEKAASEAATAPREWLAEKLEALRAEAEDSGGPILLKLLHDEPLFTVPRDMIKIFDRDLDAAGMPKVGERGRTVDIDALRHTFGMHLSKNGVAPRTAQAAMRHSSLDLTMNVYTDPERKSELPDAFIGLETSRFELHIRT